MVCKSCAWLADWYSRPKRTSDEVARFNNHLNGGASGKGVKCLYPQSCTCQHKPVGKYTRENN